MIFPYLNRHEWSASPTVDPNGNWSEDWASEWIDTGAGQKLPADHPLAFE